ncbi:MAG: molybdate ABC transporter substrate-binding protein [Bacteroidota bacterium]
MLRQFCYWGLCLLICWSTFACAPVKAPTLVVATAANMQFAMEELVAAFSKQTQLPCEIVVGSSGKLTAQIQAGAPFDVFVSADLRYPKRLQQAGLTEGPAKVYAYGQLVLWSLTPDVSPQLSHLSSPGIKHIAVANPQTAPYGQAAQEVLQQTGLLDSVQHKLVFGESIAQTNQFIISGAAELGFTALSVVQSDAMQGRGEWQIVPADLYQPIEQGVAVISQDEPNTAAQAFVSFLLSEEAKVILDKFGYLVHVKY